MNFVTFDEIVRINRRHLESAGQPFQPPHNLKGRGSLEWVLEAIRYPLYGQQLYPTFAQKAAQLTWVIIRGHVFWDGCKRTGMAVLDYFVRLNHMRLTATDDEIVDVALRIAQANDFTYEDLVGWIEQHCVPPQSTGAQDSSST